MASECATAQGLGLELTAAGDLKQAFCRQSKHDMIFAAWHGQIVCALGPKLITL